MTVTGAPAHDHAFAQEELHLQHHRDLEDGIAGDFTLPIGATFDNDGAILQLVLRADVGQSDPLLRLRHPGGADLFTVAPDGIGGATLTLKGTGPLPYVTFQESGITIADALGNVRCEFTPGVQQLGVDFIGVGGSAVLSLPPNGTAATLRGFDADAATGGDLNVRAGNGNGGNGGGLYLTSGVGGGAGWPASFTLTGETSGSADGKASFWDGDGLQHGARPTLANDDVWNAGEATALKAMLRTLGLAV